MGKKIEQTITSPARAMDGYFLFDSGHVEQVRKRVFGVSSRERANARWRVTVVGDLDDPNFYKRHLTAFDIVNNEFHKVESELVFRCECEDFKFRALVCSHIYAVIFWLMLTPRMLKRHVKVALRKWLKKPIAVQLRHGCREKGAYFTLFFSEDELTIEPRLDEVRKSGLHCPFCGAPLTGLIYKKYSYSPDKRKMPREGTTYAMQCLNKKCRGVSRFDEKIGGKGLHCPFCGGKETDIRYYYRVKMHQKPEYILMSETARR